MRIALFADIHANLEALETVLADAEEQGCTDYVCLGDVVGYNANPSECLERVRALDCPVVKGNHDEDSGGEHSLDSMNPVAAEALLWTRKQLSDEQRDWLRKLRMVRQVQDFTIVHSSLDQPQVWNYVTNKFDAMSSFSYQFTKLCFHGHTHVPRVFAKDSKITEVTAEQIEFDPNLKYFINVGSVGQPRNGDWRACYAIYDIPSNLLVYRRLEYDIVTAQQKVRAAGLPEMLATRLAEGR
ncbi:metallophosphoesterase family protein [Roseibacillus ishigakijimensis]|uniref:Metallophosphoesterase family protein n=1 Tax=Roseibacillus ishigakijimensis TaxID=454146 RepID=A0A934RWU1_9BACT|nr:metallophosphoesterase family protein [Roseibacillus ishigakijimensis]MBK1835605.1 metallophosphoesterase family protein [Roseibacillus ishigakijimensis]